MKRREFITVSGFSALQVLVQACRAPKAPRSLTNAPRSKALQSSPHGIVDLPAGLNAIVLQRGGDAMSDGHQMGGQPDGMACFAQDDGTWVLLRNHELGVADFVRHVAGGFGQFKNGVVPAPRYKDTMFGGVSRLVIDPDTLATELNGTGPSTSSAVVHSNYVLVGTDGNCAGGKMLGGWVSCEESSRPDHGYAFLTLPEDDTIREPRRITSWGRFHREAVAHDPKSGIVYMTEDRSDGCFYRFLPEVSAKPLGRGRLQALVIDGLANTNPYDKPRVDEAGVWQQDGEPRWPNGMEWPYHWVDVPDPQAKTSNCREQAAQLGATAFHRGEGIAWDGSSVWFCASTAGASGGGQIFRVTPRGDTGKIVLELEVRDRTILSSPDNVVLAPNGDLVFAEDNYELAPGVTHQHLRGMTRSGEIYNIARNPQNDPQNNSPGAEFTGACFSPDGRFLFVNLQRPRHLTIAITSPFSQ